MDVTSDVESDVERLRVFGGSRRRSVVPPIMKRKPLRELVEQVALLTMSMQSTLASEHSSHGNIDDDDNVVGLVTPAFASGGGGNAATGGGGGGRGPRFFFARRTTLASLETYVRWRCDDESAPDAPTPTPTKSSNNNTGRSADHTHLSSQYSEGGADSTRKQEGQVTQTQFVALLSHLSALPEFDLQDVFAMLDKEESGFVGAQEVALVMLLLCCADAACMSVFKHGGLDALLEALAHKEGWSDTASATDALNSKDGSVEAADLATLARVCGIAEDQVTLALSSQGHRYEDSLTTPQAKSVFDAAFATLESNFLAQKVAIKEEVLPHERSSDSAKSGCKCVIL